MAPDYKVYNYFKSKFLSQVEAYGRDRMDTELGRMAQTNKFMSDKCGFTEADNKELEGSNKWWGPADLVGYKVQQHRVNTGVYF